LPWRIWAALKPQYKVKRGTSAVIVLALIRNRAGYARAPQSAITLGVLG